MNAFHTEMGHFWSFFLICFFMTGNLIHLENCRDLVEKVKNKNKIKKNWFNLPETKNIVPPHQGRNHKMLRI